MSRAEILSKIQAILRDILDDDTIELTEATAATDVPEWDSTNHVRLLVGIEAAFHVRFETEEITASQNVGELVTLVQDKLK